MKVNTQDYNKVTVVELQGELDGDAAEVFRGAISNAVQHGKVGVVLDMHSVSFIASEGLSLLLWARDYSNQNSVELRMAGLDENCMKILEVTRLDKAFDRYQDLAAAVKSIA